MQIVPNTPEFNKVFDTVWGILLLAWPLWLVALVILWFFGDRKWWRLFVPIGLGILLLVPALFFVWLMANFTQHPG